MEDGKLFTVGQREIVQDMLRVQKFREQRSTTLYMDYVFFESDGKKVVFSASDMENTATSELHGIKKIEKPFKICIEKTFLLPLNNLECDISFETVGDVCIMHSPDGKVTVPILEADNFPRPDTSGEELFLMPEGWLLDILQTFIPFVFNDPLSSNNALHFKFHENALRVGAYDGFMCAATEVRLKPFKQYSFMLSSKSASMLAGVLRRDSQEMCSVSMVRNDIVFSTEKALISCRQMRYNDMSEPNDFYRMSMPFISNEADIMEIHDKEQLMQQLHKATVFNSKANQVVSLELSRNRVTIDVEDTLMGRRSVQEYFPVFKHEGKTERAFVNCNRFMSILRAIPSNEFELRVPLENGPGNGCIGTPLSVVYGKYVFILSTLTT